METSGGVVRAIAISDILPGKRSSEPGEITTFGTERVLYAQFATDLRKLQDLKFSLSCVIPILVRVVVPHPSLSPFLHVVHSVQDVSSHFSTSIKSFRMSIDADKVESLTFNQVKLP